MDPITETTGTVPEPIITEPSQTPIEQEIERESKRGGERTEAEKAAFSLKKNAERAIELGLDPSAILGIQQSQPAVDKDAPLTVGMYEQMQKNTAQKSAIELAESIADQHERELTIQYLKTRIVPSGDANEDVRFARLAVNSVKNGQIVEEISRTAPAKHYSSGAGAPPNQAPKEIELTPSEQMFTKAPFNMSAAEIVAKRTS